MKRHVGTSSRAPLRCRLLLVAGLLASSSAAGQTGQRPATADSTIETKAPLFPKDSLAYRGQRVYHGRHLQVAQFCSRPAVRKLALPVLLLGTGVLLSNEGQVLGLDVEADEVVRDGARKYLFWVHTTIEDQLRHLPAYATLGLAIVGVKGQHGPVDQALRFGLIYYLNGGLTSHLKRWAQVERPVGNDLSSFPSGHTSAAFSAAHFMHKEYGSRSPWYSVGAYSVATGALRIAQGHHWLSDVVAGAGVGILSTELVYWAYPALERTGTRLWNQVRGTRPSSASQVLLLPFYSQGAGGATLVVNLQ